VLRFKKKNAISKKKKTEDEKRRAIRCSGIKYHAKLKGKKRGSGRARGGVGGGVATVRVVWGVICPLRS